MSDDHTASQDTTFYWIRRGMRDAICLPTFFLMCAMVGFAGFAKESGIIMEHALLMSSMIWALPACVVLVAAISHGLPLLTTFIAVTLSSARMLPMVIAIVPEMRTKNTRTWVLLFLSHFVAVTAWVVALRNLKDVPRDYRTAYFGGLACLITFINQFVVLAVYLSANSLPPIVLGPLFFLTPVYFLTSLWGSARESTGKIAMVIGLLLGPLFYNFLPNYYLLLTGIIGGTLAYLVGLLARKRSAP